MIYQDLLRDKNKALEILLARAGIDQQEQKKSKEKKRLRFNKLANKRVGNALKSIKILKCLSNKSKYSYSEEEFAELINILKKSFKSMKKEFIH